MRLTRRQVPALAGAVTSMIPCIVLYVSLQRFYVQGLASGAVKG